VQDLVAAAKLSVAGAGAQAKKRAGGLKLGQEVTATVELVKSDARCCVVRVHGANGANRGDAGGKERRAPLQLAFLSTADYNMQHGSVRRTFKPGQEVTATVARLPSAASGFRLFLSAPLARVATSGKRAGEQYAPGSVAMGKVLKVKALYAQVSLKGKVTANLHACDVGDLASAQVRSCLLHSPAACVEHRSGILRPAETAHTLLRRSSDMHALWHTLARL
jgi:hypothetical protein